MNASIASMNAARATKSNLMEASGQWATRPADERYWNLADLFTTLQTRNAVSAEKQLTSNAVKIVADKGEVCVVGSAGIPAKLTNWSFSQLCTKYEANADYLRRKSPELAALNLNDDMSKASDAPLQLLMHKSGDKPATVRAVTTDYTRLWNGQIVAALMKNGLQNGWTTPPARPSPAAMNDPRARKATKEDIIPGQDNFALAIKEGDMIAPAGVYEGDRDMFIFLVNPTRIIDDGGQGLMRGVFIWNSEVGAGAFSMKTFMLENVCGNHICWGASNVQNFRQVHRGPKIKSFADPMLKCIEAATPKDVRAEENQIRSAKALVLGKDKEETIDFVYGKKTLALSKRDATEAFEWAVRWEHTANAAPTTAWGFVHGLTRYSQTFRNADQRDKLDTIGGKILDWANAS
jgi:hypothetical protein